MIARNGKSYAERLGLDNAASANDEAVRLGELNTALAAKAASSHTHASASITDFAAGVDAEIVNYVIDSDTLTWAIVAGKRKGTVRVKSSGGLLAGVDGVELDFGTGANQAARGNHTHAQLHDAATVKTGLATIQASFAGTGGQELDAEVKLAANSGLLTPGGLALDFGAGANQAARGNHTHAQLHDALTKLDTQTLALSLTGQQLSGTVRYDPAPGAGKGKILSQANGAYVALGAAADQAAAGDHVHANASSAAAGFLSPEQYRAIQNSANLLNADQCALFARADELSAGKYVGGKWKWGQSMKVIKALVTADAPAANCVLGLEVGGTVVDTVDIPGGAEGTESSAEKSFADLNIPGDTVLRIKGVSGVGVIEQEPARINVVLCVRPAIASLLPLRINAGGAVSGEWAADQFYSGGAANSTATTIDTTGITDPPPSDVMKTWRSNYFSINTLNWQVSGLARGVNYKVRLHFAEAYWDTVGQQIFNIRVVGLTTLTTANFDILGQAGGVKFKAVLREYTLQANSGGQIQVQLQPLLAAGNYHSSLNALEFIPI